VVQMLSTKFQEILDSIKFTTLSMSLSSGPGKSVSLFNLNKPRDLTAHAMRLHSQTGNLRGFV